MSDDWLPDDPFADPEDPAAREREQRRREREEKRRSARRSRPRRRADARPAARRRRAATAGQPPRARRRPPRARAAAEPPATAARPSRVAAAEPRRPSSRRRGARRGRDARAGAATAARTSRAERRPTTAPPAPRRRAARSAAAPRRHRPPPVPLVGAIVACSSSGSSSRSSSPSTATARGQVAVTIPKGASVSEVGDLLEREGRRSTARPSSRSASPSPASAPSSTPGRFTLADGMSYGAAIDALSEPPVKRVDHGHDPRGLQPLAGGAAGRGRRRRRAATRRRRVRSKYLDPAEYGGKDAKDLEGFLFPDTFELKPSAPAADLVQLQLQDFKRRIKGVDMSYAQVEEPDRLRRAHDRLDDRATRRGVDEPAQAGRRGDLQPPARRDAARDRRDDPLRHRQLHRAADRIGTGDRLALQHAHQRRPAAGADRQPRPRLDRSRRPPGQGRLPLLRGQAGRLQRARLLHDRSRIRSRRRHATTRPAKRPAATRRPAAGNSGCRGSPSSATRSATRARRRCRTRRWPRWGWRRSGATRRSTSPRTRFEARVRAMPGEGFAGANVTVPHKEAALALADELSRDGARDRRRQHARLRRRRDPRRQHRRRRPAARRCRPRRAASGRWCSAPAAPPGPSSGRCCARAPRSRSGTAPSCAPSNLCEELGGEPVADARSRPPTS